MKITVKVDNQSYAVEVGDIHDRPVLAFVDGETFEVWPEEVIITHPSTHTHAMSLQQATPTISPAAKPAAPAPQPAATGPASNGDAGKLVRAPIPGVILAVAVKPGDVVAHGQELCVLEAMKMKNVIRASRAGTIGTVCIVAQQHVKHHDVLMEFANE